VTPDDLKAARQYARAYARWRCGGALPLYAHCPPGQTGRGKLDPVYVEETEGRDQKAFWDHYSSCGDLSQGLAYHLGVRKPYVNRAAMPGGWHPGRNLLHFYDPARGSASYPALGEYCAARITLDNPHGTPAIKPGAGYVPAAGDLGFIWSPGQNNAHTFVFGDVLEFGNGSSPADAVALIAETFNFGAGGMTRTEYPGAHCVESKIERRANGLWFGQRKLQFIVPLKRLLADSDGLPAMSGEVIDELERRVP
jgi:hypothetical protein